MVPENNLRCDEYYEKQVGNGRNGQGIQHGLRPNSFFY